MTYDTWLWGKKEPFCSLSRHMMAVGACVWEYLTAPSNKGVLKYISRRTQLAEDEAMRTFSYVAALHDIGKAHPAFQRRGEDQHRMTVSRFRHEQYGARLLERLWIKQGWDRRSAGFYAAVVRVHHQGKGEGEGRGSLPPEYESIQIDLENRMRELFTPDTPVPVLRNADALGALLSAILIICDWVASSERFGAEGIPESDDRAMFDALRTRAAAMLRQYGLISDAPHAYPRLTEFTDMWPQIPQPAMRPLQQACESLADKPALLTLIEAPMGEGKTEAALYLAGGLCRTFDKRGIYMALPTAATSNQMVGRVRDMLEAQQSGAVRLLHSMAWLVDDQSADAGEFISEDAGHAADWLRPLRRGMLAENAVGTVDQAMAAAVKVKYGFLRLGGLAGKVLIIDEIHAYDIFMSTIIARLLQWCRALEIPVVLLSATMQLGQRQRYLASYGISDAALSMDYPLITQVTAEGTLTQTSAEAHRQTNVRFRAIPIGADADKLADLVLQRAAHGGCICVMLNTVRQAQAVYRRLRDSGEDNVMLFHARFTAQRRAQIERECTTLFGRGGRRPERMILVCTQVVEQSLDVDFDTMITQLAPMDLLLQRAGRVHRHADNLRPAALTQPTVDVIIPDESADKELAKRYNGIGPIYSPIVLKNTESLIGRELQIAIPQDVRACVERAYADLKDVDDEIMISRLVEDQLKVCKAEDELLRSPLDDEFFARMPSEALSLDRLDQDSGLFVQGAQTRDGTVSATFLFLPEDYPADDGSRGWLKGAMEFSCNLPLTNQIKQYIINVTQYTRKRHIELRADGQNIYHWMDYTFSVSDEYGVEEVSS